MIETLKSNIKTIVLVAATLILAVAAIITAWRLYQLNQKSIAPTAPQEAPAAQPQLTQCQVLSFALTAPSTSPTASPSTPPTTTPPTTRPTSNPSPTAASTTTPTASPIAAPISVPRSTATAKPSTSPTLPQAGLSWPTIAFATAGLALLIVGAILAF